MHRFQVPKSTVEAIVARLKKDGVVHPDATFNNEADGDLRMEIAYRDLDFLIRVGRSSEDEVIVDAALQTLVSLGLLAPDAGYDKAAFESYRAQIKEAFKGTWTSVTDVMERLIYALTAVRRPRRLVELGSFWGNTLAWFAGPCIGSNQIYEAEEIYGIDIDEEMTEQARKNFARLENCQAVKLWGEDAATALERIDGPIDFLYLEAKDETNKSGYLEFLKQCYDKLPKGAWVIAHDSTAWAHQADLAEYLAWVRDNRNFAESVSFDVDMYGLELSVK